MLEVRFGILLKCPKQPLLHAKPLFCLRNLLHNRKPEDSGNYVIRFVIVLFLLGLFALSNSCLCCNSINFGVCCISTMFFLDVLSGCILCIPPSPSFARVHTHTHLLKIQCIIKLLLQRFCVY